MEKQELSMQEVKEVQQGCAKGNYPLGKLWLSLENPMPTAWARDGYTSILKTKFKFD